MQCPVCKTNQLEPVELEYYLIGAGCKTCKGVLLSLIQYRHWLDHYNSGEVQDKEEETVVSEESEAAKLCPKCQKMMIRYRIGTQTKNRLDLCSHCDEAWLDKGEWHLLKKLDLHNCLPSLFTDAWQRNIRKLKEQQTMETHYTAELGETDFKRLQEFKIWLDKHPKAGKIKHYLHVNFDV